MSYTITEACNGCGACKKICPVEAVEGKKKKVHSITDTVCIECGACGRVCPQGAVLDQSGTACVMMKRSQWGKPVIDLGLCMSCTVCVDACPLNSLVMSEARDRKKDPHGYPYLKDEKACIGCGFCALECPVDAITMTAPALQ